MLGKNSMHGANPTQTLLLGYGKHADRPFITHLAYSLCLIVAPQLGYREIHTDSSYPTQGKQSVIARMQGKYV
jgi:hypothetical protein